MSFSDMRPAIYSMAVMLRAMPAMSSTRPPAVSVPWVSPKDASRYRIHRPEPYSGT